MIPQPNGGNSDSLDALIDLMLSCAEASSDPTRLPVVKVVLEAEDPAKDPEGSAMAAAKTAGDTAIAKAQAVLSADSTGPAHISPAAIPVDARVVSLAHAEAIHELAEELPAANRRRREARERALASAQHAAQSSVETLADIKRAAEDILDLAMNEFYTFCWNAMGARDEVSPAEFRNYAFAVFLFVLDRVLH